MRLRRVATLKRRNPLGATRIKGKLTPVGSAKVKAIKRHPMADSSTLELSRQLRSVDPRKFPAWKRIATRFKGVKLYAIECPEQTVDIGRDGHVVAHANLLLTARTAGIAGRLIDSSISVPAKIEGKVRAGGQLNVESFAVSL
jgi:hypothetical protein